MDIKNWFKRKTDKPPTEADLLHNARMESLRKKSQVADEIIKMMDGMASERRIVKIAFEGPEKRHG